MSDEIVPPARGRRRLLQTGAGNPAGWRWGARNKAALAGDMLAMKLCLERLPPQCDERPVTFSLPSLAAVGNGEIEEPSPQNVSRAMNGVTTALACGEITPG